MEETNIQKNQSTMRNEIIEKRKDIMADMMNFSVGEIINLYKDKEINLEPAFQRLFRWSEEQQTKFIESLLLGFPIPPIFVYQTETGVWEVVDGVQRISSLLNFMGLLQDDFKNIVGEEITKNIPLLLKQGDIIKELLLKCWDENTKNKIVVESDYIKKNKIKKEDIIPIDKATAIDLKRAKIPVIILTNKSEESSKLELFKRLNSGGSHLCDQELRNALIYMVSPEKFEIINLYSKKDEFRKIIGLDDNGEKLSFDKEVITRYLIIVANFNEKIKDKATENADEYFDRSIEEILRKKSREELDVELQFLIKLAKIISENFEDDYCFKNYDDKKKKLSGQFSWYIFETVIYGALLNREKISEENKKIIDEFISKLRKLKLPHIQGTRVLQRMLVKSIEEAKKEFNFG
ncbi:MAG: DUF262 domain-containing protein [Fusobacteriaceae bacterium]